MNKSELVFKAIDVLGHAPQNAKSFEGIVSLKDISYGTHNLQKGDLYFKDGINKESSKKPIILYIHGGGFIKGDKKHRVTVSEYYANEGFYVFSVNYRLPPDVSIIGQVLDCVSALNYIKTLADKYNIDLNNILVTGDSSGSCQATFLAALKFDENLRKRIDCPEIDVDIKGLMLMSGIYDVEELAKNIKLFGVIPQTTKMILDFDLKSDFSNFSEYEYYDCICPTKFVNEKWCPAFVSWAKDDLFCKNQGDAICEALTKCNVPIKTHSVKGITNNHCYHLFLKSNKYAEECMQNSVAFAKELCDIVDGSQL